MFGSNDPNFVVAGFAISGLLLVGLWRLIAWIRDAPVMPDPWDAEVERKIHEPETAEICPHCSTPQPPCAWFCQHCGRAVGPYNNLMPFVHVFSEGEVFRNGTSGQFRNRPLILIGYFLISLGSFAFFAPIFWLSMLLNWTRQTDEPEHAGEQNVRR
jgi:hypothetical protein